MIIHILDPLRAAVKRKTAADARFRVAVRSRAQGRGDGPENGTATESSRVVKAEG
jgi:hypothetical protein